MPIKAIRAELSPPHGFTLVEVMICLFILAGGMLGMTALQTEVIKYNHAAFIDSQAQFLMADMAERIRANRGNDAYVIAYTETAGTPGVNCESATCLSNAMVAWDLYQWRSKVEDNDYLPAGQSQIVYDALTRTFTISIRYDWSNVGGVDISDGQRTLSITERI